MFTRPSNFTYGNYQIANIQKPNGELETNYLIQIQKYESQCLQMILGESLYADLLANVELGGGKYWTVKTGSDAKWGKLVNGASYTGSCGNTVKWKGLVTKVATVAGVDIIESLAALYAFYYISLNERTLSTGVGEASLNGDNATQESSKNKRVDAWNELVQWVCFGFPNKDSVSLNQFLFDNKEDYLNAVTAHLKTLTYYDI